MDTGDSLELSAIHGSREIAANKMPHKPAYSSAVMSLKLIVLWERHWMYINLVIYEVLGTVLSTVNMLNTVILPKTITCVLSYSLDRWETAERWGGLPQRHTWDGVLNSVWSRAQKLNLHVFLLQFICFSILLICLHVPLRIIRRKLKSGRKWE